MKHWGKLISIIFLFASCKVFQPVSSSSTTAATSSKLLTNNQEDINPSRKPVENDLVVPNKIQVPGVSYMFSSFNIEQSDLLQFKYAILLDTEIEKLSNFNLYQFIERWWGTPYRLGGSTNKGIDCSAFVQQLLSGVYDVSLPRTASEQKRAVSKVKKEEAQEGDLVFFNTRGGVSHVGVYLHNNKFVHASTSGGVMISDLNESYWRARYLGAGRIESLARH